MEMEFEQWFDIYVSKIQAKGYTGNIDRGSAQMDYEAGLEPDEAAETFLNEMNS